MEVITYSEWLDQSDRQIEQDMALLAAQRGADAVAELPSVASFPVLGTSDVIYLAQDTNKLYTWNATSETYVRADIGTDYVLPTATPTVLGGVKVGDNLSIAEGVLSATAYTLPTATDAILGGVKVGDNLSIAEGVLSGDYSTFTAEASGLTPAGGSTAGTFLKYDGSWAVPPDTNTIPNITFASTDTEPTVVNGNGVIWFDTVGNDLKFSFKISGYLTETVTLSADIVLDAEV